MSAHLEGLEKERDFYFAKVRHFFMMAIYRGDLPRLGVDWTLSGLGADWLFLVASGHRDFGSAAA